MNQHVNKHQAEIVNRENVTKRITKLQGNLSKTIINTGNLQGLIASAHL